MLTAMKNLLIFTVFTIIFSACNQNPETSVKIATAANMQFAMDELITNFEQKTGIKCETVVSSSSKLTAQIKAGAPFDIFVSADMKYPDMLYHEGFGADKPKIYANGTLVLWTNLENTIPAVELLSEQKIKHIAVANPKTAPYGLATEEFLKNIGKFNSLKSKFIFGESVSVVNRYIYSRSAEIGFTAKSVVLSPQMKDVGKWIEIAQSQYSPIDQGALLLKSEKKTTSENAKKFYDFLFSEDAEKILNQNGYTTQ